MTSESEPSVTLVLIRCCFEKVNLTQMVVRLGLPWQPFGRAANWVLVGNFVKVSLTRMVIRLGLPWQLSHRAAIVARPPRRWPALTRLTAPTPRAPSGLSWWPRTASPLNSCWEDNFLRSHDKIWGGDFMHKTIWFSLVCRYDFGGGRPHVPMSYITLFTEYIGTLALQIDNVCFRASHPLFLN